MGMGAAQGWDCVGWGAGLGGHCRSLADHLTQADVLVMGSVELSNPKRIHQMGSVCARIAKETTAHFCIIKNVSLFT